MKVSKAYYNRFKKAFLYWQEKLGLTQYRIDFFHRKLEDVYAEMIVYEKGKFAQVILTTELNKSSAEVDQGPEAHAKHEAIHLLIHRISWLGECRYITDEDLGDECEAVVVRLEKIIK